MAQSDTLENRSPIILKGRPFLSSLQISEFCGTFVGKENEKYQLQLLKFYPEMNMVIGKFFFRFLILDGRIVAVCGAPVQFPRRKSPVDA